MRKWQKVSREAEREEAGRHGRPRAPALPWVFKQTRMSLLLDQRSGPRERLAWRQPEVFSLCTVFVSIKGHRLHRRDRKSVV